MEGLTRSPSSLNPASSSLARPTSFSGCYLILHVFWFLPQFNFKVSGFVSGFVIRSFQFTSLDSADTAPLADMI